MSGSLFPPAKLMRAWREDKDKNRLNHHKLFIATEYKHRLEYEGTEGRLFIFPGGRIIRYSNYSEFIPEIIPE
jgi:hypothetical protein